MKHDNDNKYEFAGYEAFSSIQSDELMPPPGAESGCELKITMNNAHLIAQALVQKYPSIANALHDELDWQLNQVNKHKKEKGDAA